MNASAMMLNPLKFTLTRPVFNCSASCIRIAVPLNSKTTTEKKKKKKKQEIPDMSTRGEAAYGYNEFITRLRKARTDKETEKKRVKEVFPSGDGWNGQQTVPKEFSLGQGGGKDIRSLKKPSIRDGFFRQQLNGSFEEKVTFSGFDVISDSETDHQLPYQAANGINLHTHPTAPSWTTGHIDGQSHREGSVDDFLSQQHSNVMAVCGFYFFPIHYLQKQKQKQIRWFTRLLNSTSTSRNYRLILFFYI